MRRLFKKYKLLVWLALLLSTGVVCGSVAMLTMSSDLLTQQSAAKTLPALGDGLALAIRSDIAKAQNLAEHGVDEAYVRDWLLSEEPDNQALIAYLKAAAQQDNAMIHFLVTEKDQKYIDSQGSVRTLNQNRAPDGWYAKALASSRPYKLSPANDGSARLVISRRLFGSGQQLIGVTGISMTPDSLIGLMNRYALNDNYAVYVADQLGNIVFGDSRSKRAGNLHQLEGISAVADALLIKKSQAQPNEQSRSYEKGGARYVLNSRYIPELDWYLIVEENTSQSSLAVWPLVYVNGAIGILVTILALLIAGFSVAGYYKRLHALASKDSMTGLLNRQSFTRSFQQTALEMQRLKLPLSFILFDIDFLKKINASHGHANGDKIIRDIARLSKRSVRGSDLICRWGGEQFALLLRRCELEQAYKIAEQLRVKVQNHAFSFDEREANVTISLGVAQWTENETMDALFGRVNEAVFFAKSEGRNRAEISLAA